MDENKNDGATSAEAELATLESRLAAVKAGLAAHQTGEANAVAEMRRFTAAMRADARMGELEKMGIESPRDPATGQPMLTKAQMMALVPDVDPREPNGMAALAVWKSENKHLFRVPEDPSVTRCRTNLNELVARSGGSQLFSVEAAMRALGRPKSVR